MAWLDGKVEFSSLLVSSVRGMMMWFGKWGLEKVFRDFKEYAEHLKSKDVVSTMLIMLRYLSS